MCATGIILVTMVLIVCLSFSGYLVNNIPVYFKWIGKLSYFSYAYAALVRRPGHAETWLSACASQSENGSVPPRG